MTHRSERVMEALRAIHRTKRPPATDRNLARSAMSEIRSQKPEEPWDLASIAFPFSAVACAAAVILFMIGTGASMSIEDLMLAMLNGGTSITGMPGFGL